MQVQEGSGQQLQTDALGQVLLDGLSAGRQRMQVEASGFIPTGMSFELGEGVRAGVRLQMLPLGEPSAVFNTEKGVELEHQGVELTIAPGPLMDAEGRPIEGDVELFLVPVELENGGLRSVPGMQQGLTHPGAQPVNLESVAMMALVFRKKGSDVSERGIRGGEVSVFARRIGIRGGVPRSIRAKSVEAPLGALGVSARAAVQAVERQLPVWRWDPQSGYWVPTGEMGRMGELRGSGREEWSLEVERVPPLFNLALPFWWRSQLASPGNPLQPPVPEWVETACLEVRVEAQGQPVAGRTVVAQGVDYVSISRAVTDGQGVARLEVVRGRKARVEAEEVGQPEEVVANDAGNCQGQGAEPKRVRLVVASLLCAPGETLECAYGGPLSTRGQGACRAGRKFCNAEGTGWSASCVGEVLPQLKERCETQEDDNCDGLVNEGCASVCKEGTTRQCYTGPQGTRGVGQCRGGTQQCVAEGTAWSECGGQVLPQAEDCGRPEDEDCDGVACQCWPGEVQRCGYTGPAGTVGVGECRTSTRACNAAGTQWGACTGEVTPQPEVCANALDEDCNGNVNDAPTCGWTVAAPMAVARTRHTATLLGNGKVLVVGGENGSGTLNTAEVYEPATNTWSSAGTLNSARRHHTATLLSDGKVLVVG
jgi:hypothetical protein